MIYHFKDDLKQIKYKLGTPLKYSNEFTFIPLKIQSKEFMIPINNDLMELFDVNGKYIVIDIADGLVDNE